MTSSGRYSPSQRDTIATLLSRSEERERVKRRIEAEQLADLGHAVATATRSGNGEDLTYRALRFEVAALLSQSEYSTDHYLSLAYALTHDYAATLETLRAGEVSVPHARDIVEIGAPLSAGHPDHDRQRRATYEEAALAHAREMPPHRLRPILKRLVAALLAQTATERHAAAHRRRHVRVIESDDGMADLIAHLPAEDAYLLYDLLTKKAVHVQRVETREAQAAREASVVDPTAASGCAGGGRSETCGSPTSMPTLRSRGEARADVFVDLLAERRTHGTTGRERGIINVIVPATLLTQAASTTPATLHPSSLHVPQGQSVTGSGPTDSGAAVAPVSAADVAELVGYGPIDTRTAARLAGAAQTWDRTIVDDTGNILSVDRYRPTPAIQRRLAARDLHCRAPGCRVPAHRCEIDHTIAAAEGGATATNNLAHLCPNHHTLKHHTDWKVSQDATNGELTWTSPTGRVHVDRPASRVRFTPSLPAGRFQPHPSPLASSQTGAANTSSTVAADLAGALPF